jgi:hypothetical protein
MPLRSSSLMKQAKASQNVIEFLNNRVAHKNVDIESYMSSQIDLLNSSYSSLKERYSKYFKGALKDKTNTLYEKYHKSPAKFLQKISPKKAKSELAIQSFETRIHIYAEEICGLWDEFLKCIKENPKLITDQMERDMANIEAQQYNGLIREKKSSAHLYLRHGAKI